MNPEPKDGDIWLYCGKELVLRARTEGHFDTYYKSRLWHCNLPSKTFTRYFKFIRRGEIFSDEDYEKIFI